MVLELFYIEQIVHLNISHALMFKKVKLKERFVFVFYVFYMYWMFHLLKMTVNYPTSLQI